MTHKIDYLYDNFISSQKEPINRHDLYTLTGVSTSACYYADSSEYVDVLSMLLDVNEFSGVNKASVNYILDKLNVPDNLTFKERLAYLQLLGDTHGSSCN